MAKKFRNFYIDYVPRQQNAHADALASFTASLALSTGAIDKVLIYSHGLYYPKFALKNDQTPIADLKVKEVQQVQSSRIGNSHTLTTPCMVYYPMTPKR